MESEHPFIIFTETARNLPGGGTETRNCVVVRGAENAGLEFGISTPPCFSTVRHFPVVHFQSALVVVWLR